MKLAVDPSEQTEKVVNNHLKAFAKGDIDAIMADFADDAIFYKSDGVLRSKDEIRPFFEGLLKEMPSGSHIQVQQRFIDRTLAYMIWSGESESVEIPFATDTKIVRNGKIIKQTFAAQILNKT